MRYTIHKGINTPLEFKGLQAQYVTYLGLGTLAMFVVFALGYLLGVNLYIAVFLFLTGFSVFVHQIFKWSHLYGQYGMMKRLALRRIPGGIRAKDLKEKLPVEVEPTYIRSKSGDITLAFRLNLLEVGTLCPDQHLALHEAWIKAIKTLPTGSVLHKQDWFRKAHWSPMIEEERSFHTLSSDRFFTERPYLEHEAYLMLTQKTEGRPPSSSALSNLLRPTLTQNQKTDIQHFEDQATQFIRILEDTGLIETKRLKDEELKAMIDQYHAESDLTFKDGLMLGDQHARLFAITDPTDLPEGVDPEKPHHGYVTGFATALGPLLKCNHLYSQFIFIEDTNKTIKDLEQKMRRKQSLSKYSRNNATGVEALNKFLTEAANKTSLPVKAHFNIMAWAEKKEDLREARSSIGAAFAQMGVTMREEILGAPQIYWAGMPGNAGDFPMNDTFDTFEGPAVCFLNQETRAKTSMSPIGIRMGDRQTGVPVHVDISDEPIKQSICDNRNKFILGPSGSGKSFFTNHLVRTYYDQGTHIVIVDVGHSYQGLCRLVNGYYFTCSETEPLCFNPFFGDQDSERRESIKTLLVALWKKDSEETSRSEYVALSDAIQAYYEYVNKNEVFPCFNTFYEFIKTEFAPNLNVRKEDFNVETFLFVLRPYYKGGELDTLLNARENLDLINERFIVFELDQVKDHPILFPVVTIIIMEVFISKMRRLKGIRKMIVIEEAWKAIAKAGMAEYIRYLYKTVRKFYGEAVVVTQEVDDIIDSPIVKQAIINNADCKVLLDQSKYQNKFEDIQKLLGLTDYDKALVLSLNKNRDPEKRYKEVFINLGGRVSKVYRLEVSPEEYWTYTTEESEKMKVMEYLQKHGGNMRRAILALVLSLTMSSGKAQLIGIILKKAINVIDLKVQQEQLETMDLQATQKVAENDLSQNELSGIAGWLQQEESLFQEYYQELWQIKSALSTYNRVKGILKNEQQSAQACAQAMALFRKDPHFSNEEIKQLNTIYTGFIDETSRNLDQLSLLITGGLTQMGDGHRLELIDQAADRSDLRYQMITDYTQKIVRLSLQRARDTEDRQEILNLYGGGHL